MEKWNGKWNDTIDVVTVVVVFILKSLKHEKSAKRKLLPGRHLAEYWAQTFTTDSI